MRTSTRVLLAGLLALPASLAAQVQTLVIGEGGADWASTIEQTIGLDTALAANGLQPVELNPSVNINVGPLTESGQFTNIFGGIWGISTNAPDILTTDGSPFVYGSRGRREVTDGDTSLPTSTDMVRNYSFDFGLPLPISRVVFFPPSRGRTTTRALGASGLLVKDLYPRQYVVSGSLSDAEYLFSNRFEDDFDVVLEHNLNQSERVADVRFATQFFRFLRLRFPVPGFIAEVFVYGEGFAPQTKYVSQLFDMGEPVNFGRLHYVFERHRTTGFGTEQVLAPDAAVQLAVETRTGRDETPLIYHVITELGSQRVVDLKTFNRAPAPSGGGSDAVKFQGVAPGQRGDVLDDVANWSFWSAAHLTSGEAIRAPDGRQFIQVRAFLTSEEVLAFGRLKSMSIEFSPLLANPVLGEVALVDEPNPQNGVVEVPLGEPITLTYDVRAEFSSSSQTGFSAIRLNTPEAVEFQRFEMGEPLVDVQPDSLIVNENSLAVYFPSNPVAEATNTPIRLTFSTRVFNFNTLFEGEVFQIGGENLPQSIDGGDASSLVSTNDLRVFAPLDRLEVLSELDLSSPVLTPNVDGVNDVLELSFTLHGIEGANVDVGIYDLSGRLIHRLVSEPRGEGRYAESWDTMVKGTQTPPGTYLLRVAVATDLGTFEKTRTIAIAY
ncbi:MAG TPA: gliding motility-associated C-terminal domain-containing protein [Candidatus Latescibacteria bacterium]|nr:gliding motility-associated C-terminal domain-containing protein [Candidatus Latescibacterota bacterium]